MSDNRIPLNVWITNFVTGRYNSPHVERQMEAGWFDWFCSDKSLAGKTKRLGMKIVQIAATKKFDLSKVYVFFKNNCPLSGNLYDQFSICDLATGEVLYCVVPKSGHKQIYGMTEVYSHENAFKEPVACGRWSDALRFFLADGVQS